jgi:hypothetical protein
VHRGTVMRSTRARSECVPPPALITQGRLTGASGYVRHAARQSTRQSVRSNVAQWRRQGLPDHVTVGAGLGDSRVCLAGGNSDRATRRRTVPGCGRPGLHCR